MPGRLREVSLRDTAAKVDISETVMMAVVECRWTRACILGYDISQIPL